MPLPTARYTGGKRMVAGRFEFDPSCAIRGHGVGAGQNMVVY